MLADILTKNGFGTFQKQNPTPYDIGKCKIEWAEKIGYYLNLRNNSSPSFLNFIFQFYMRFSKLAREIYLDYTNQVEPFGLDESWADVTGSASVRGDGMKIAEEIRKRIKFELGIAVSIGVSDNKIFA